MSETPDPVAAGIAEQRLLAELRERVGWQAKEATRLRGDDVGHEPQKPERAVDITIRRPGRGRR